MAQAGAEGTTRDEIEALLHREDAVEPLVEHFGHLTRDLQALAGGGYQALELSVATALWAQAGYRINPSFAQRLQRALDAEAREVNFAEDATIAARTVNAWVAKHTGDRITSILPGEMVSSLTRCILANAIYLKAPWRQSFLDWKTRLLPFYLADGTQIEVPTMYQGVAHAYAEKDGIQAVQLHYRNPRVSMVVLIPEPDQLERAQRGIDSGRLKRLLQEMKLQEINLFLPRFHVESLFVLRSVLERLELKLAFSERADFTGVSNEPGFRLDEIMHRTYVQVDESGTEAAGATLGYLIGGMPDPHLEVHVDRPLFFSSSGTPTRAPFCSWDM